MPQRENLSGLLARLAETGGEAVKCFYAIAQIVFIVFAIVNMAQGNVFNYDFIILAFLMAILRKLEEINDNHDH